MKRILQAAGIAVGLSLALAACGGGATQQGSAGDDTFVIAPTLAVVTELDPGLSSSNEIILMQNVYESLTRYNPETEEAEPLLATEWESSEDGLTWTFALREGVTFHTGRELDATAVKEALDRTRESEAGGYFIWDAVSEIVVTDPLTVTFELSYPVALPLVASSGHSAYIYDVEAAGSEDLTEWFNAGNDAGTGPYELASWEKGAETEARLTANEDYWGGWEDGQFRGVDFRVTPDANTSWQLLQSGEVDYVHGLTPQLFQQAEASDSVQTSERPTLMNLGVFFNTESGPLADANVRKALQLAIDYEGLVATLDGSGAMASGIVPEGLLGHVEGMEGRTDLDEAAALLEEAGYGPGGESLDLELTYAQGDEEQASFATLLVSGVQELGGTLTATPMDWNAQWDLGKSSDADARQDIFVMYWYPYYPDAYSWFSDLFRSQEDPEFNLSYVDDEALDERIDALPELTATDPDAAQEEYEALQRHIVEEEAYAAFPYVVTGQRVLSNRVEGFVDNPAYNEVVHVYDVRAGH